MESGIADNLKLPAAQYEKRNFRTLQANLPYPEKVKQVVEMQRRLVPVYAARGIKITPWKI